MTIKSSKNPIFKKLMSLTKSKGLKEEGQALVSGEKVTEEIAKLCHLKPFWIMTEDMDLPCVGFDETKAVTKKNRSMIPLSGVTSLSGIHKPTVSLSKELFHDLDIYGTGKPLLCCQYDKPKSFSDLNSNLATLYVAISDPGNLGALVRSCVAFHWPQIVLLSESAHPFLPKVIRSSSGTVFKMSFFGGPSIQDISDSDSDFGPEIVALDKKWKSSHQKKSEKKS